MNKCGITVTNYNLPFYFKMYMRYISMNIPRNVKGNMRTYFMETGFMFSSLNI